MLEVLFTLQCSAVEKHFTYGVTEFGVVSGADKIKAEIYARGPVSCGIDATSELEQYTGGIFSQFKLIVLLNHELSVSTYGHYGVLTIRIHTMGIFQMLAVLQLKLLN